MLCRIARWAISRAEDRAARTPRWVERHLVRCGPCRDYARFAASLKGRLAAGKDAFLRTVPEFPVDAEAPALAEAGGKGRVPQKRRLVLRPVTAAAGFAMLAAALILWQVVLKEPGPSPEDRAAALAALKSVVTAADEFPGAVTEAESSLERERRVLERSVASAVEYLEARLNVKIVRREAPKSS